MPQLCRSRLSGGAAGTAVRTRSLIHAWAVGVFISAVACAASPTPVVTTIIYQKNTTPVTLTLQNSHRPTIIAKDGDVVVISEFGLRVPPEWTADFRLRATVYELCGNGPAVRKSGESMLSTEWVSRASGNVTVAVPGHRWRARSWDSISIAVETREEAGRPANIGQRVDVLRDDTVGERLEWNRRHDIINTLLTSIGLGRC